MSERRLDGAGGADRPLDGVRVVDLTRILSGPYATMLLADLGAEIIKVERPDTGDDTRSWGPPFWDDGISTYFAAVNRGKRSVALDLRQERGRELLRELVGRADVLVENFRPGVTERLGISYATLAREQPGLVYATINGFGSRGPKATEAGTEVIVEAETGLMAMMGTPDGPPVRFGVAMVDIATGMALVSGVLAALLRRERTGDGAYLEFPLYATAFSCLATVVASASVDPGSQEGRWGSAHPSIVPYAAYAVRDGHVVLGAINEPMWARLCASLGLDVLRDDPRARTNDARVQHRRLVDETIGQVLAQMTADEVVALLGEAGVLVAPVRSVAQAVRERQVAELGLLDTIEGVHFARSPLSQFNPMALSRAEHLGAASADVLRDVLGVSETELARLTATGVVGPTRRTAPSSDAAAASTA